MRDVRVADPAVVLPVPADEVERWATAVLDGEGQDEGALSVTFLTADEMQELNRQALGRDRPTDVIAFRLEDPQGLVGDVYVCPFVAEANASAADVPVEQELLRLVVHGVLHVLGHDHPQAAEARAASPMWAVQEAYVLQLWDTAAA